MEAKNIFLVTVFSVLAFSATGSVLKQGKDTGVTVPMLHETEYGRLFLEHYDKRFIFPGTKWCGDGDIASDPNDLGFFSETDKCCRSHDFCDDIILAGESNHGLTNDYKYTALNCKCDDAFYECLGQAGELASNPVAIGYFNMFGSRCFAHRHPATCIEWDDIMGVRERCVKWSYDESQPKEWQWFDLPRWILGPDGLPIRQ